jgi:hypothetical protein
MISEMGKLSSASILHPWIISAQHLQFTQFKFTLHQMNLCSKAEVESSNPCLNLDSQIS